MKYLIKSSLLTSILLIFITSYSQAGLNTYSYSITNGTYTALTTPNILVASVMEFPVRLPFRFRVDTVSSDSLFININGFAALRKDPTVFQTPTPQPLASNLQYSGVLSPFATNLYPGYFPAPSGAIRLDTSGTAPNRIFTVNWQNKQATYGAFTLSFQLRLHEGSNIIEFVYGPFIYSGTGSSTLSGQIGLRCVDTSYFNGGITGLSNVAKITPSSYQYLPWLSAVPITTATDYGLIYLGITTPIKPDTGLTYTFTPAPACSATRGAGTLSDSTTVCYGATVVMKPMGTPDSMIYQWQSSTDNGTTWTNFNGGVGGNFLTAVSAPVTGTVLYRQKNTCLINSGISYTNSFKLMNYPGLSVPYFEGFEGVTAAQPLPDCMVAMPSSAAGAGSTPAHTGKYSGRFNSYAQGWLISPGINLQNGKSYRFTTWYYGGGTSSPDSLRLAVGTFPNGDSLNTAVSDLKLINDFSYRRASYTFTVPASGRYFAGIRWAGGSGGYANVNDIEVYEVPPQDAAIDTFIYPLPVSQTCYSPTTPVTIRVRNTGLDTLRNIPVSYSLNNVIYGPETIATAIPPGGNLAYTFTHTANLTGIYTSYSFRAWAALPGDGTKANDTSYLNVFRTDTVKTVPYTQTFDGLYSIRDVKWYNPFPNSYSTLYNSYSWKNTSPFFYWSLNSMPANSKDSIGSTPFGPIHANTFMTFDYRVMDLSGLSKQYLNTGDTLFVLATADCGTSRDTLMKIHSGNQYYSDSFKTIVPIFLGAYSGNTIRIAFVLKKTSTNTSTSKYLHLDNFKLQDLKTHDIELLSIQPRPNLLVCSGESVPVKIVIRNNGGFSETGFPINVLAGTATTPALSYTYPGTLNYGQIDTVNMGLLTPAIKAALPLKAYVAIVGDTSVSNDSLVTSVYIVDTAVAPAFTNSTICDGDSLSLDAGGNDSTQIFWYSNSTSVWPTTFVSPMTVKPRMTTTYYASARHSVDSRAGKPTLTNIFGSGVYSWGLILNAESDLFINSMAIYPTGSGTINVNLVTCAVCASPATRGNYSYTFSGATGTKVMVPVKTYLPKGDGYFLSAGVPSGTLSLGRDFPYSGYPIISSASPLTVSSGWGNGTTQFDGYYYYYDFVVKALACESARMPVTVIVDPKPSPSFTYKLATGTATFTNFSTGGGRYFWDFGDGDTSSVASPVHTYSANGTYHLRMFQTNSCGTDSLVQPIIISDVVGVAPISGISRLSLFPNPAVNTFTISFNAQHTGNMRMILYNELGVQVASEDIALTGGAQTFTRDIGDLPSGNYLLLFCADRGKERLRLVITRK